MLVLTRKLGETIVIGDDIIVKVVDIHGKQIRLGIEAPTEITIFRGEIYERILEEKRKNAAESTDEKENSTEEKADNSVKTKDTINSKKEI